jgi:hypothetical protein
VNCASTYGASTAAQPRRNNRWDPMQPCRASNHGTKQFEMPFPTKFKVSLSKLRVRFLQQRLNHDVGHGASTVESNPRLHGTALVTLCSILDRFYQQPSSGILHATVGVSVTAVLGQRVQTVTIQCPQRRAPEDTDCTAFRLRIRR